MTGEAKQRKRAKNLLPTEFEVENAMFTFSLKKGGEEIRAAPCAQITDLVGLVFSLLDENDRYTLINPPLTLCI